METALNFDHILLFKTSISSNKGKQLLHTILDKHPSVQCWNIDMEDSDYVLRIISATLSHTQIIEIINYHGYQCCELT